MAGKPSLQKIFRHSPAISETHPPIHKHVYPPRILAFTLEIQITSPFSLTFELNNFIVSTENQNRIRGIKLGARV
ncbi:hypothetical protein EPI10_029808 [Gossypium australe]|uniref:Uncharacterized protein n=1 Tax=Gossypium australe TaxID=47621 RepID=A0A5B6WY13_9ROSI|nr:hypothetical protein EPI10_029808 [Gossypium australe]